ncbi:class I SAM-dependent methyltransferase [Streptomyces sp. NPDC047985]|uniref:class I SAM-dependent methyltransferase n=1 Tax=unclassified Streptomyces TaxID=2593676 RepID=UPI00343A7ADA
MTAAESEFAKIMGCRVCGGNLQKFIDFGRQPVSNAFVDPADLTGEVFYDLAMGQCSTCTMVQQLNEVPRDVMFHSGYPYRSSESRLIREHFERTALEFLDGQLSSRTPFVVEIGCNDGVMLETLRRQGVRHLGVDPSAGAAEVARERGSEVRVDFFDEASAAAIRFEKGPADLIFSANTISHLAYFDSVLKGVDVLLAPDGVLVFEDRYLGDIVERTAFDQIYDEHYYLLSARSMRATADRFGFELVDAVRLPVHGGSLRYTLARPGTREVRASVQELLADEERQGLGDIATLRRFADTAEHVCQDLVGLLRELRADGRSVAGYGATSKSATILNHCGIGPDLIPYICDSTQVKQHLVTPGSHIPVRPPEVFADPYPEYAVLFAWNHEEEIMAKERQFAEQGGKWILYVPGVHIV